MFDDEELEQIRDEQDEWQGHVDRQTVKKSRTSRGLLIGSMTASTVMAVVMVFIAVSGGLAAQALIGVAGVGGFAAEIQEVDNADNIAIYPALGPTAACDSDVDFNEGPADGGLDTGSGVALPQLRAEIGNLSIPPGQALILTKDINLPDTFLTDLQTFRVSVKQNASKGGNVNINDAILYLTGLKADQISIQNAQIREFFSENASASFFSGGNQKAVINDNARPGEFAIQNRPQSNANAQIINASARAHFVAFDQLDIENIQIQTKYGTVSDPLNDVVSINSTSGCPAKTDGTGTDGPTGST
jgi:hypothetical protein